MKFFARLLNPRFQFFFFAVLALFVTGLVAFCSPEQFPIVLFFDMAAFPYASPDSYLDDDWRKVPEAERQHAADFPVAPGCRLLFAVACLRRIAVVAVFVLAVSLGL